MRCVIEHVKHFLSWLNQLGAASEFQQTIVLKFEKGEHTQWTSDSTLLYHIEGLMSLWMYSFLEVDEPGISYHQRPMEFSTWLAFQLKNRVLKDYFVIIGGEEDKDLLRLVGAEAQNIVRIMTKVSPSFDTPALPRNYIPVLPYDEEEEKREKPEKEEKEDSEKDFKKIQPNFVPRQNLFGRCPPHDNTLYAYKYPLSPGTPISHNIIDFSGGNIRADKQLGTERVLQAYS